MIGSYFRKERNIREERAGTMIGIHPLKERIVFMLTGPLVAGLPADGIFPEEFSLFMKYSRAAP